jgi:hypothetical protein
LRELVAASPEAADLVAKAEHAVTSGGAQEAWGLYARAWALAPRSPVPGRGICRLALALGIHTADQRRAATDACERALLLGGTPEDIRNRVGSLIDGEPAPVMADLVEASLAAEGAARLGPGQPWGPASRGDLALRLGDRELLDASIAELRQLAPAHRETRRLVALARGGSSRWSWLGGLAIVLLFIITVAHAVRGRLARRRALLAVLAGALLIAAPAPARAQPAPPRIDDAHPERSVPTPAQQMADPLGFGSILMELGARANAATRRQDFAAAARYYGALARAVPGRSYAFSKLCDSLEATGRRGEAIAACGLALSREGTVAGDFTHFVRLLLAKPGPLTSEERHQADVAVAALEKEPQAALIATRVRCNIAVHEHDLPALESCTAKLLAAQPGDAAALAFAQALVRQRADQARARRWARAWRWSLSAFVLFGLLVGGVMGVRRLARGGRRVVFSEGGQS